MDRLDEMIGNVAYILDSLRLLREIEMAGTCNNCQYKQDGYECEYLPKAGQLVRYNCPFYRKPIYIERPEFDRKSPCEKGG